MSSLEEFESALRDVVSTKRVSLSKMNKLSEVAKKCFENDVQMVSMLYRTHKALQPQFKVPSLYAFDALAREARSHALKHGVTGDAQSGNSATFLLKLEAVLDGLFQDMMSCGVSEGKEKSKKILDIWTKSTTFPPAVLTRLGNVLKGDDAPAVPAPVSNAVIEPVMRPAPPQAAPGLPANAETHADPASQTASVQATLLALLTQASNAQVPVDGPQTLANNVAQVQLPRLDTNQLKLFQQLTQTVNSEVTSPPIQTPLPPPPAPASSSSEIVAGPSNPPAHWNNSRGAPDKPWDAGRNYQTSLPGEENDYHGYRGRFRGGYRSRGRGRFGDRDREGYRDRFYDNARGLGVAHGGRRSRSRSPPRSRYGDAGRRDAQPYSPPHRPSVADQPDVDAEGSSSRPGVDEFGREIRPSSDDDGSETLDDLKQQRPAPPQAQSPPVASTSSPPTPTPAFEEGPGSGEHESSTTTASQVASATSGSNALPQDSGDVGLESFDYSTFDPTSPASWEALGRAWAATNGRHPSQEELMMFVMEVTVGMTGQANPNGPGPAMQGNHQRTGPRWMGEPRGGPLRGGRGRGRGGFGARGGRGSFAYGHSGEDGQARWDHGGGDAYANTTDAIVLGEHTDAQNSAGWGQGAAHEQVQAALGGEEGDEQTENQGAVGGRMQKMGDGWVFTRNDGSS
ncbi:hypothetical protein BC827DRAFT_1172499 [Russula dissimulans]|nr:hypothetical protein BC827DRAFT_1172499 [Russula dissimulans]